jgi:hypothetical protein
MARNINLKLTNLKINTNMDHLYDSKTPNTTNNKKLNTLHTSSPKKKDYNSIIVNSNINSINNINISSMNSKYHNNNEDKYKSIGQRSNSKQGLVNNIYGHTKSKTELDIESRFYPQTFSPKTAKVNNVNNKLVINSGAGVNNKFLPLSTRNSNLNTNTYGNLHSTGNSHSTKKENNNNEYSSGNFNENGQEMINVMSLLGSQNNIPITIKNLQANIPNYDNSKFSVKSMSVIKAYAANTHQGIIR